MYLRHATNLMFMESIYLFYDFQFREKDNCKNDIYKTGKFAIKIKLPLLSKINPSIFVNQFALFIFESIRFDGFGQQKKDLYFANKIMHLSRMFHMCPI